MKKFEQVRLEQFPLTEKYAYLDTASTGIFSVKSKNAMTNFIEHRYADGMDFKEFLDNWNYTDSVRDTAAKVINADSDEMFFSGSGSDMLNVFSNGIILKDDANVVTTDMSFPSTVYTWFNRVGEQNVKFAASTNGQVTSEEIVKLVDEDTAVISLCMVENTTGFCHDIKEIGEFCKDRGIYLVLDATQCIGAMKIDVKAMHIDFLIATTYKWLCGPFGISFAYVSKRVIDKVRPTYIGWTGNKDRHNHRGYHFDLADGANRFETGSLNWTGLQAIEQSMKIYLELGKEDVEEYILSLTGYLYEKVAELKEVKLIGPFDRKNRSGITYLVFPQEWALSDATLRENGIRAHVTNETSVRISIHYYNNKADIDKLISFLASMEN